MEYWSINPWNPWYQYCKLLNEQMRYLLLIHWPCGIAGCSLSMGSVRTLRWRGWVPYCRSIVRGIVQKNIRIKYRKAVVFGRFERRRCCISRRWIFDASFWLFFSFGYFNFARLRYDHQIIKLNCYEKMTFLVDFWRQRTLCSHMLQLLVTLQLISFDSQFCWIDVSSYILSPPDIDHLSSVLTNEKFNELRPLY